MAVTFVCWDDGVECASAWRKQLGDAISVVETDNESVADDIAEARDRGGVVGVATREGEDWLSLGADEAVSPTATAAELGDAIERARARANWRDSERAAPMAPYYAAPLTYMGAALAHSLRNSLAAATLNVSVLEELAEQSSDRDHALAVGDIQESLEHMTKAVNELVLLADDEGEEACDASSVLIVLASWLKTYMIRFADFDFDIQESIRLALSTPRLVSVVAVLLDNATHAVGDVTTRDAVIALRLRREDDKVVIEVTDNGVGMDTEARAKALHPFFTTRAPPAHAFATGLPFVAWTVRRIGGEIVISSERDVGTTVRLYLPRVRVIN